MKIEAQHIVSMPVFTFGRKSTVLRKVYEVTLGETYFMETSNKFGIWYEPLSKKDFMEYETEFLKQYNLLKYNTK